MIGALLTFAGQPLYETYLRAPRLWGITVLADQQLGGLVMWVVGGLLYLVPIFVLLALILEQEERASGEPAPLANERTADDFGSVEPDASQEAANDL